VSAPQQPSIEDPSIQDPSTDVPSPDDSTPSAGAGTASAEAAPDAAPVAAKNSGAAGAPGADEDDDEDDEDDEPGTDDLLVREGDVAGDYLERLLDILDVDGDIDLDVEGDRASVAIVGGRLNDLIGPDGATLEALQELTRLAVAQSTGVRSRLMLDVGGFRAKRRADLSSLAGETAKRVAHSRQPERLSAMNPFERKVVHDVIASVAGVRSESEGEEPNRRVVVLPER
jgi:spoIIIJ-associated protein